MSLHISQGSIEMPAVAVRAPRKATETGHNTARNQTGFRGSFGAPFYFAVKSRAVIALAFVSQLRQARRTMPASANS